MKHLPAYLFFVLIVRPFVLLFLGLNVRRSDLLPQAGPAIVTANHNSHLDTIVLMSLFPLRMLPRLRPVAAADYFLKNRFLAWFALDVMGIIPINRKKRGSTDDPLAPVSESLMNGDIVILFPEGSRGEPEQMSEFKNGVWHLARRHPEVPVHPVLLHGLGKALPRGEALLVPFFCDVFVGNTVPFDEDRHIFMDSLNASISSLEKESNFRPWE